MVASGFGLRGMVRRIVVAASAVVAVVGSFIGSGAAGGTPIAEAAGGALSASATAIAPAGPAFGIWSVIYVGLVALAVWQFLPHRTAVATEGRGRAGASPAPGGHPGDLTARHDRLGIPVTLSLLLNAAWILSVQAGLLRTSGVLIVLLLASLVWAFVVTVRNRTRNRWEALIVDGTIGLYLGWVCVATAANVAAILVAGGFRGFGLGQDVWGVAVAVVAGVVGIVVARGGHGRIAPMLSLGWGLAWVAVARLQGPLVSVPTAVAAIVAVVAVVGVTLANPTRFATGLASGSGGH